MMNDLLPPQPPEQGPPMPAASTEESEIILNDNDVLLGRGLGASQYIGNRHFRDLVDTRRAEYMAIDSYNEKGRIGREVYDEILRRGGRFLEPATEKKPHARSRKRRKLPVQQPSHAPRRNVVRDGVWEIAPQSVGLEKCKQALREKEVPKVPKGKKKSAKKKSRGKSEKVAAPALSKLSEVAGSFATADAAVSAGKNVASVPSSVIDTAKVLTSLAAAPSPRPSAASAPKASADTSTGSVTMANEANVLHSTRFRTALPSSAESHLSVYQQHHSTLQRQALPLAPTTVQPQLFRNYAFQSTFPASPMVTLPLPNRMSVSPQQLGLHYQQQQPNSSSIIRSNGLFANAPLSHLDESALALAAFTLVGLPHFTEQDEQLEASTITDEERVDALCDLFGQQSILGVHPTKRARKDLDRDSLNFLLGQMKLEIGQLPMSMKLALMEAKLECRRAEEFSDERLEKFLRCEGMNTKAAALRFVNYWEGRKEVFGSDKFHLPMTLAGALRDDLVALEAGVYRLFPNRDISGRQLMLVEPGRNTGQGFTEESLLRALWYTIEVTSQECTDLGSGFVYIGNNKNSSIRHFGARLYGKISHYEKSCWPVHFVAVHTCGVSRPVSRIMTPIVKAMLDRWGRSRMVVHDDTTETERIPQALIHYGITKYMLPIEMGGTVQFDQSAWIASRRAIEMEEIH